MPRRTDQPSRLFEALWSIIYGTARLTIRLNHPRQKRILKIHLALRSLRSYSGGVLGAIPVGESVRRLPSVGGQVRSGARCGRASRKRVRHFRPGQGLYNCHHHNRIFSGKDQTTVLYDLIFQAKNKKRQVMAD